MKTQKPAASTCAGLALAKTPKASIVVIDKQRTRWSIVPRIFTLLSLFYIRDLQTQLLLSPLFCLGHCQLFVGYSVELPASSSLDPTRPRAMYKRNLWTLIAAIHLLCFHMCFSLLDFDRSHLSKSSWLNSYLLGAMAAPTSPSRNPMFRRGFRNSQKLFTSTG